MTQMHLDNRIKQLIELAEDGCKQQMCERCIYNVTCELLYQEANLSIRFEKKTRELAKKNIEQIICEGSSEF